MNLAQELLGLSFAHPIIAAAGKWAWTADQWKELVDGGAAGITTKSYWDHEHKGNVDPVVVQHASWTLNAVGLPDFGPDHSAQQLQAFLPNPPIPLIVSIVGMEPKEYAGNAARLAALKPSALEVNLSSPTFLKLRGNYFSTDDAVAILPEVKAAAGSIPIFVKLSPNIPDIGAFAARCIEAGADGITAINTLGTGLAIDLHTRTPILSAKRGGISGPGIKPLAVRCIADIREAVGPDVPIIGIGGVTTGEDAAELIIAGANLVGLATAILREGPGVFARIKSELEIWGGQEGVTDIREVIGSLQM